MNYTLSRSLNSTMLHFNLYYNHVDIKPVMKLCNIKFDEYDTNRIFVVIITESLLKHLHYTFALCNS